MARKVSVKKFSEVSKMLARWPEQEREQIARDLMRGLPARIAEDIADAANRAAYHQGIRELAEDFKRRIAKGDFETRDDLIEAIHETVDGHHDVIYTAAAQKVLVCSDNAGAYVDDFGTEGVTRGGDLNWSGLAYCAMERDLFEQLSAEGVDVNADFCTTHHVPEVDGACPRCEEAAGE